MHTDDLWFSFGNQIEHKCEKNKQAQRYIRKKLR